MKKMDAVTDGEDKTLDMIWEAIQEHEEKLSKKGKEEQKEDQGEQT
jgi:hypothetical protein